MNYHPYSELVESSRYRLSDLPPVLADRYSIMVLRHYNDAIVTARPRTIDSIVVLPSASWDRQQPHVTLFTFGSFRSVFRTIETMSQILADQYLEFEMLPIVQPITSSALHRAKHEREVLRRRISKSGLLLLDGLQSMGQVGEFNEDSI